MLLCLPFTDGALKGHFGKVELEKPPFSVAVKVLCLQHVREVEYWRIQGCAVSISVRCNDDSRLASLDPIRTHFTIPTLYFLGEHPSLDMHVCVRACVCACVRTCVRVATGTVTASRHAVPVCQCLMQ